ncbi:MAG: hypothetical protein P1U36_00175 [Legionellaceae bacterium]|nr:hypothetical protein [Legionellaceae bacterium]
MNRASALAQLDKNKAEITVIEECLMGSLNQEDSTNLLAELKALMDERYIYMQTLAAFTQGYDHESSVRFFTPERVDLNNLENLASLEHECTLEAENMISDLILRFENHEITQAMFDGAQAAIRYELEFLNATTVEEFEAQSKAAIEQAFALSSSQTSYS